MSRARYVSAVLIVATAALLIGWDIYAVQTPGASISEVVRQFAVHPIVPFSFGVLMGHFFGIERRV